MTQNTRSTRRFKSDDLGEKGESYFQCAMVDADLKASKSTRDRRGWDYIVDWPHQDAVQFDSRPTPISCHVQVKTVYEDRRIFKMRLTSAEFIAKDVKPSFIHVLKADSAGKIIDAAIIHVQGDILSFILRRLREARRDGRPPNTLEIEISIRKWATPIAATGEAFRAFVEQKVGSSMSAYVERKAAELKSSGYSGAVGMLSTTFLPEDQAHLADAFLGIRPIAVAQTSATERRFDIELPLEAMQSLSGEVEVLPSPIDSCEILASWTTEGRRFAFEGQIFAVPRWLLKPDDTDLLIRSTFFDMRVRGSAPAQDPASIGIELRVKGDVVRSYRGKADEWRAFYGFMAAGLDNAVQLEIQGRKLNQAIYAQAQTSVIDELTAQHWRYRAEATEAAALIFERVGATGHKFTVLEIMAAAEPLLVLKTMIEDPRGLKSLDFETRAIGPFAEPPPTKMLYINHIRLGENLIAYAAEVDLASVAGPETVSWRGTISRLIEVARLKATDRAYQQFAERVKVRSPITVGVVANFLEADVA